MKKKKKKRRATSTATDHGGSIVGSMFLMLILSILLSWLPVLGSFLAGYLGGRKAGSPRRAFMASILPVIALLPFLSYLSLLISMSVGSIPGGGLIFGSGTVILLLGCAP